MRVDRGHCDCCGYYSTKKLYPDFIGDQTEWLTLLYSITQKEPIKDCVIDDEGWEVVCLDCLGLQKKE